VVATGVATTGAWTGVVVGVGAGVVDGVVVVVVEVGAVVAVATAAAIENGIAVVKDFGGTSGANGRPCDTISCGGGLGCGTDAMRAAGVGRGGNAGA
jgi:hypothetical protein